MRPALTSDGRDEGASFPCFRTGGKGAKEGLAHALAMSRYFTITQDAVSCSAVAVSVRRDVAFEGEEPASGDTEPEARRRGGEGLA